MIKLDLIKKSVSFLKKTQIRFKFSEQPQDNINQSLQQVTEKQIQTQFSQPQKYQTQPIKNHQTLWPVFKDLNDFFIEAHYDISFNLQLYGPFRWTPLIQITPQSYEFLKKMRYFSKLKIFKDEHKFELIDTFLFEALKNSPFDYYYNYDCQPSKSTQFHGTVDFMIYNKESKDHLPLIPVITSERAYNKDVRRKTEFYNKAEVVGVGVWALKNMRAQNSEIQYARVLQTNGSCWKMYEISENGEFRQTGLYTPNTTTKRIYHDNDFQQVILGLIKYSCDYKGAGEVKLQEVYDFVNEKRYLTSLDKESKSQLDRSYKFWSFLPKKIRKMFFKY